MIGLIMIWYMQELLSQVNAELMNMGVFEVLTIGVFEVLMITSFIFIIAVTAFSGPLWEELAKGGKKSRGGIIWYYGIGYVFYTIGLMLIVHMGKLFYYLSIELTKARIYTYDFELNMIYMVCLLATFIFTVAIVLFISASLWEER